MKKHTIVLLAALSSGSVFAAGIPVGSQFSAGQPARANDVNANFQELADRIDDNIVGIEDIDADLAAVYEYAPNENLVSRTFINANPDVAGECDRWVDTFAFNTSEKTFVQSVTTENTSDSQDCTGYTFSMDYSEDVVVSDFQLVLSGGSVVDYDFSFSNEWVYLKPKIRIGDNWANFNLLSYSNSGGSPILNGGNGFDYRKRTFIGVEDVSVNAGNFEDCLVIEDFRNIGGTESTIIYYHCAGPGLARRVELTAGIDWQLESYVEN